MPAWDELANERGGGAEAAGARPDKDKATFDPN